MLKFSKYEGSQRIGGNSMKQFVPKMYQESIYTIHYKKLQKKGVKCLLFDLDNTCVGYHEKEPTKKLTMLFQKLQKMGFLVIIFSNATKKRLIPFQKLGVRCHHASKKPFAHNFKKIMNEYHLAKEEVCIIGDQLFTDICGGNKVGIITCLVKPITKEDFIFTKILRAMEERVFQKMEKEQFLSRGNYYE